MSTETANILEGRRALVTGASAGIGRGVAVALAKAGADVIVNYPDPDEQTNAEETVAAIAQAGRRGIAIRADVADETEVDAMVSRAMEELGGLDILVNNAGIAHTAPLQDIPVDVWDRVLAVHLRGTFLVTRAVLPHFYAQNYGKVINTASQLAYKGAPALTHYTAAKGAIISLTRSLALEVGSRNITVNAVAPGATRTRILENVPDDIMQAVEAAIPRGTIAEVDEIVPTYVFLASDASIHYRGQCLSPNGGDVFL